MDLCKGAEANREPVGVGEDLLRGAPCRGKLQADRKGVPPAAPLAAGLNQGHARHEGMALHRVAGGGVPAPGEGGLDLHGCRAQGGIVGGLALALAPSLGLDGLNSLGDLLASRGPRGGEGQVNGRAGGCCTAAGSSARGCAIGG
eukprot:12012190-Alexandrium_andersonii.AAC.1